MLSQLTTLTTATRILHIYPNNVVKIPDAEVDPSPPTVNDGAAPIILEIHSLTSAQLNQVQELERSVTPPIQLDETGKPMLDEYKDPISNYKDSDYQKRKAAALIQARCIAIYHGCDSIRKDLAADDKDYTHLPTILSHGLIETISANIIHADNLAFRPDFLSPASSATTQS